MKKIVLTGGGTAVMSHPISHLYRSLKKRDMRFIISVLMRELRRNL